MATINGKAIEAWDSPPDANAAGLCVRQVGYTDGRRGMTLEFKPVNETSSGDHVIVPADPAKKILVCGYILTSELIVNVTWKSGATALTGPMRLSTNVVLSSGFVGPGSGHWFETGINQALILNQSANANLRGHISFFRE